MEFDSFLNEKTIITNPTLFFYLWIYFYWNKAFESVDVDSCDLDTNREKKDLFGLTAVVMRFNKHIPTNNNSGCINPMKEGFLESQKVYIINKKLPRKWDELKNWNTQDTCSHCTIFSSSAC